MNEIVAVAVLTKSKVWFKNFGIIFIQKIRKVSGVLFIQKLFVKCKKKTRRNQKCISKSWKKSWKRYILTKKQIISYFNLKFDFGLKNDF